MLNDGCNDTLKVQTGGSRGELRQVSRHRLTPEGTAKYGRLRVSRVAGSRSKGDGVLRCQVNQLGSAAIIEVINLNLGGASDENLRQVAVREVGIQVRCVHTGARLASTVRAVNSSANGRVISNQGADAGGHVHQLRTEAILVLVQLYLVLKVLNRVSRRVSEQLSRGVGELFLTAKVHSLTKTARAVQVNTTIVDCVSALQVNLQSDRTSCTAHKVSSLALHQLVRVVAHTQTGLFIEDEVTGQRHQSTACLLALAPDFRSRRTVEHAPVSRSDTVRSVNIDSVLDIRDFLRRKELSVGSIVVDIEISELPTGQSGCYLWLEKI